MQLSGVSNNVALRSRKNETDKVSANDVAQPDAKGKAQQDLQSAPASQTEFKNSSFKDLNERDLTRERRESTRTRDPRGTNLGETEKSEKPENRPEPTRSQTAQSGSTYTGDIYTSDIAVGVGGSTSREAPPLVTIPGETVLRTNFADLPEGTPSLGQERDFKDQLGPDVLYIKGFGAESQVIPPGGDGKDDQVGRERAGQTNGPNDRVRVGGEGDTLEVLYPKGGNTTSHSGVQYLQQIPGTPSTESAGDPLDEVIINYQVRFDEDFQWQGGGKLPGVVASTAYRDRADLGSIRLMWREDGRLEFYIHTDLKEESTRLFWDNGQVDGHAAAPKGEWVDIQFRVKLNSVVNGVPQEDGVLEGWMNGEQVAFYDDVILRADESTNINSLFFSTFYGGSSGSGDKIWWPTKDTTAQFSDVQIVKR